MADDYSDEYYDDEVGYGEEEDLSDDDDLSPEEEGFMKGYDEATENEDEDSEDEDEF